MKIYLDQNILSNLAKQFNTHEPERFLKFLRKNNAQLVLSAAHVWETAKASKEIQELIIDFVKNVDYQYITSAQVILELELRSAFQTFLGVPSSVVTPFGYIFHPSDQYVPFSSLITDACKHLGNIYSMDSYVKEAFNRHQSEKSHSKKDEKLQHIKNERKELLKFYLEIPEIWARPAKNICISPNFIKRNSKQFLEQFDLSACLILNLYTNFLTLKFRDLKVGISNYKIYDTEHAVIGAYYCDYLICEKNMAGILRNINDTSLVKAKIYKCMSDFLVDN